MVELIDGLHEDYIAEAARVAIRDGRILVEDLDEEWQDELQRRQRHDDSD